MQNPQYPLKIVTSGLEVISSGVVHLVEPEVKFSIASLTFKFRFKSESGDSRFESNIVDDEMIIDLFNFNNSLGQGKIEPMEVGTISGRRLFITFFVNTIEKNLRQFNYTFLLKEGS